MGREQPHLSILRPRPIEDPAHNGPRDRPRVPHEYRFGVARALVPETPSQIDSNLNLAHDPDLIGLTVAFAPALDRVRPARGHERHAEVSVRIRKLDLNRAAVLLGL